MNHDNKLLSGQTSKYQRMSNGPSANFSTTENFNFKLKLYHRCSRQICECCASVRVKSGQKSWDSQGWKSVIQWRTSTITNMTNAMIITTKAQTFIIEFKFQLHKSYSSHTVDSKIILQPYDTSNLNILNALNTTPEVVVR